MVSEYLKSSGVGAGGGGGGGGGGAAGAVFVGGVRYSGSIFAGYVPQASQNP